MVTPPSTVDEDVPATPTTSAMGSPTTEPPSWKSIYDLGSPPDVARPYEPEEALEDIPGVCYALETFLSSHMLESEEYCHEVDEVKCANLSIRTFPDLIHHQNRERLYFATGYGLIQCIKGLMSYEDAVSIFSFRSRHPENHHLLGHSCRNPPH